MKLKDIIYLGILGKAVVPAEGESVAPLIFYGIFFGVPILIAIFAYFMGCINFGIILSKKKYGEDIRTKGSGNAGATNMLRTYGTGMAAVTFLGDALKAVVSVGLGILIFGGIGGSVAALACMIGHAYPCFYGFKGGKGVAVTAGAVLMLDWRIFLILLVLFVVMVLISKYISLGSITAFLAFPMLMSKLNVSKEIVNGEMVAGLRMPPIVVLIAFIIAALGIFLHRENLKRLLSGTENKFSLKPKKDAGNE